MHVTATFPPYWGGTGNVAYHHVLGLHERGHAVEVVTAVPRDKDALSFPFPVHYLPAIFRVGNAPFTPKLGTKLQGFDIIHLHYPYIFGAELCVASSRATATPLVVTYHNDLLSPGWKGSLFGMYSALVQPLELEWARRVVATSADYAQHSMLSRSLRDLSRVVEIPNGVDAGRFTPRPDGEAATQWPGIPDDAAIVLFVGAMDTAHFFKGVTVLIEALSLLEGVHGLFVGDGDLRPAFEATADERLPGRAHFVGSVPPERLIDAYRSARVTVLPSTTQGEAFGVVLLESLACGTPVVASNLPGVRTVVDSGRDGFLADPGDARGLARAIARCLDREVSQGMGEAGRQKVLSRYTWEQIAGRLEALYGEVLGGCGA